MKKRLTFLFLLLFTSVSLFAQGQSKGPAKHVVLISVDGFRPEFYHESKWAAPNIRNLMKEGVHAKGVRPVNPSVTYPNHITMITGALPSTHGVYHNQPFDPQGWNTGKAYADSKQIQSQTLWEAVKKAGGVTASLIWPVSGGAPVDFNVPSYNSPEKAFPAGFLQELETEVTGKFKPSAKRDDYDYFNADLRTGMIAGYILEKHKPAFMTVHLLSTDHFQHEQGREGSKVEKAIAVADVAIGQMVEATKRAGIYDQTVFVICGDHGFEDRHTQLAWNALLIKEGLLENKPDRGNWKACFKDQFLMLRDKNDKKTLAQVRKLLEEQPPHIRKLYRIVEREELDQYGADPNVVLSVHPVEGVVCTSRYNFPDLVQSTPGGSHGLLPDRKNLYAGFVAAGPGLRKGMALPHMGMEDVAPLIAYLLGIDFKAPQGILYPGIIDEKLIPGY